MRKSGWISEFKTFIMRGNVLDMAVGVVIGSAFTAIVTSVVENLLTPIIALIMGKTDFSGIMVGPFGIGAVNRADPFLCRYQECSPYAKRRSLHRSSAS